MAKSKAVARYEHKLLAGVHQGFDYEKPVLLDNNNKPRNDGRRPSRLYAVGDRVWDNADLSVKLGKDKFQLIADHGEGADSRPKNMRGSGQDVHSTTQVDHPEMPGTPSAFQDPTSFPGGQVSTGKQEAGDPNAWVTAHPAKPTEEDVKKATQPGLKTGEAHPKTTGKVVGPKSTDPKGDEDDEDEELTDADLDGMTVQELKEHCQDNEIALHGATTKADIVKEIKKNRGKK